MMDRLLGVCLSLMVAAIALSVAATVVQPYLPALATAAIGLVVLAVWRAWRRSRW